MSAKCYHTLRLAVGASATTAAADYPASHVLTPRVRRPWRSTTIGAEQNLILDLGSSLALELVGLQDCNFAGCDVYADDNATPTTLRGSVTLAKDKGGRFKASAAFSATARYVRVSIPAGATTDGAAFFRVGYLPVFGAVHAFERDPLYGSSVEVIEPMTQVELANDQGQPVNRGPSYSVLRLGFAAQPSQDVEQVRRFARAALCWVNLEDVAQPWLQFPVRAFDARSARRLDRFNRDTTDMVLSEQV